MAWFDFNKLADSNNPYANGALNVISALALVSAASWFSYEMFSSRSIEQPPRIVNSITIEPTIVLPGTKFNAHINVTLSKLCPYEVHWSLVRKTDGLEVVKIVEPVQQPPASIGTMELPPFTRYIPASVAPGDYRYVAEVYDLCAEGHTYISVRHNADITVR